MLKQKRGHGQANRSKLPYKKLMPCGIHAWKRAEVSGGVISIRNSSVSSNGGAIVAVLGLRQRGGEIRLEDVSMVRVVLITGEPLGSFEPSAFGCLVATMGSLVSGSGVKLSAAQELEGVGEEVTAVAETLDPLLVTLGPVENVCPVTDETPVVHAGSRIVVFGEKLDGEEDEPKVYMKEESVTVKELKAICRNRPDLDRLRHELGRDWVVLIMKTGDYDDYDDFDYDCALYFRGSSSDLLGKNRSRRAVETRVRSSDTLLLWFCAFL
ncbi:hypothetical protein AK812_SmicGene37995 [Symbiodinium microadriaticum]|uniref:Uncharacterized protein n=1 Tax=Symbiodinium microadriaticum TaxID=2951 RepID=A0A1Q9CET9_SYMMI|nr:hypothetical protein AK812_SmicGene37995 [Symbiodinium microadriaticum]